MFKEYKMSQRFVFFNNKDQTLIPSSSASILLLPSNLALQTKCPNNINPLQYAYNSKLLDYNHQYLSFDFQINSTTQCFFFSISTLPRCSFALLDLHLPPLLDIECALFVYQDLATLCFYKDKKLAYYKNIKTDSELSQSLLLISKLYLKSPQVVLFDYGYPHAYSIHHSISLHTTTLSLVMQPTLIALKHHTSILVSLCKFIIFTSVALALLSILIIYFAPSLPQTPSSIPYSQTLNASYPLYSLLSLLSSHLAQEEFLSYCYTPEEKLLLTFSKPFSPRLLQFLHSNGYKTNILDPLRLRIII